MGAAPEAEGVEEVNGKVKAVKEVKRPEAPVYTLQALWDGKLKLKDFEVAGEEKPSLPHDVFEQDEALPVIDIQVLMGDDKAARDENLGRMLEAARSWGFFKIRNHGVPLEVVLHYPALNCASPFNLSSYGPSRARKCCTYL